MTLPIEFSAEAEEELGVAVGWFDEQRPGLGSEFLEAIDEAVSLIAEWPRTGSIIEDTPADLELRRATVSRFRFHLGYLVLDDRIRVLRSPTIIASRLLAPESRSLKPEPRAAGRDKSPESSPVRDARRTPRTAHRGGHPDTG